MNIYFTIGTIKKILKPEEILEGNFGLEKEGLRINKKGELSLTPHPKSFGNKLTNPFITTDFSESQVEIVTPTFKSINDVYQCLSFLVDIVNTSIPDDEFIWNQSIPCILPEDDKIPLAYYEGKKGEESRNYRIKLAKKYGTKKQMISGIHYNFSFKEENIEKLYDKLNPELSYKNFKNEVYLKVVRNYLRYKWLIIYLTGCSVACHSSFTEECLQLMKLDDNNGGFYSNQGPSFRNSKIGYKNLEALFPRYDSINNFVDDVNTYIKKGILSEAKELYTQIRLKPTNPSEYLDSLKEDGILYLEVRSIDINPFDKCGISKEDMEFVHLFIIYLLLKNESEYNYWQQEGLLNEELVAESAFNQDTRLLKDGKKIQLSVWASEIIDEISDMNNYLNLGKSEIIKNINDRISNPEKNYGKELIKIIENKGFIESNLSIAINNKETSEKLIDLETIKNNKRLYYYYTNALPNNKIL